jgi:hypothetical protein
VSTPLGDLPTSTLPLCATQNPPRVRRDDQSEEEEEEEEEEWQEVIQW